MRIGKFVGMLILWCVMTVPVAYAEAPPEERDFVEMLHQVEAEYLAGNLDSAKKLLEQGYWLLLEQTEAEDAPWTCNKSWWGSGTRTTELFQIDAVIWRIRSEQSTANPLLILVYEANGELDSVIHWATTEPNASFFNFKKGMFYLYITSVKKCEWKIWIEEKS